MIKQSQTLLAKEIKKKRMLLGQPIYDGGLGESPLPPPQSLMNEVSKYSHRKEYTNTKGIDELQNVLGKNLVVGNGLKPLIYVLQLAFTKCFDGIIFHILPGWVSYMEHTSIIDHKSVGIMTNKEQNWKVTASQLDKEFSKYPNKQKFIIFNNPTNPTGSIYNHQEVNDIGSILKKYNCYVLADHIYEGVIHPEHKEQFGDISKIIPEQTIIGSSLSKEFGCGGYRFGWLVFPEKMDSKLYELYQCASNIAISIYSCPSIMFQYVALKALSYPEDIKKQFKFQSHMFSDITKKCVNTLSKTKLEYSDPQGAWYIWIDCKKYKKKLNDLGIYNSYELTNYLANVYGIIVVPGIAFGIEGYAFRFSFVAIKNIDINENKYDATEIYKAFDILRTLFN